MVPTDPADYVAPGKQGTHPHRRDAGAFAGLFRTTKRQPYAGEGVAVRELVTNAALPTMCCS